MIAGAIYDLLFQEMKLIDQELTISVGMITSVLRFFILYYYVYSYIVSIKQNL